jgi:F-type H+-transporting ATPase subunit a
MTEHINWFTVLLNKWFGGLVLKLLLALHITPGNPAYPIPNHVAMGIVVLLIAILFFLWLKPRISVEKPGATQQVMEYLLTNPMEVGIADLLRDNVAHHADSYIAMVGSIAIFVLMSNAISIFPAFDSPTGDKSVPLACAILTFVYYNIAGFKHLGVKGYAKTFAGPIPSLAPVLFFVEISLTVRLWANIVASELIYVIFLGMLLAPSMNVGVTHPALGYVLAIFPAIFPVAFILLHAFVAIVQAFVFTILPSVYIGMATSSEH